MSRLSYIATTLGLFMALGAAAAPDDGSFTIRISGPDGGTAAAAQSAPARPAQPQQQAGPAAAPRTPAPAAQAPRPAARTAAPAAAQSSAQAQAPAQEQTPSAEDNALVSVSEEPERTYQVQPQDTLWSISHRMLPLDGSVNEFQASASIYRRNPDAFAGGNVNALRRVTLNIPGTATMARESTETGAELLRRGSMQLPPLADAPSIQSQIAMAQSAPDPDANAEILSVPPRRFTAQETSVRQISRESNRDVENTLMPVETENMSNADGQAEAARASVQAPAPAPAPAPAQTAQSGNDDFEPVAASSLDFQVVRDLIENTNQRIAKQSDEVDKKISSSLLRTEKIAQSAAADTAKTEVANVMSRYESIIADLQQSNAELRANLSRMGKQIDQVRAMSSDNADALAVMQERMAVAGMTEAEGQSIVPQGPMMWILLGIGLMSLILVATLFFFKKKSRSESAANFDDDYMPGNMGSAELISSSVSLTEEQRAELKEKEEEEAAQKAMIEAEAKLAEERKAQEEQGGDGKRLDADEITIPDSMFEGDEELAKKAQQLKDSEESKKKADLEKSPEPQEGPEAEQEEPEAQKGPADEILQAWDEAAKEGAGDKDTLDAWAQALEASEQEQTPPKAVSASALAKEDEAVVSEEISDGWGEPEKQEEPPKAQEPAPAQNAQAQLNPFANLNLNGQNAAAPQNLQPQMLQQMAQMAALLGMMNGHLGQLKPEQLAQMAAIMQQSAQGGQAVPPQSEAAAPEVPAQPQPQEQAAPAAEPAVAQPQEEQSQEQDLPSGQIDDLISDAQPSEEPQAQDETPALWDTADLGDAEPELTADEKLAQDWAAAMANKQGKKVEEEAVDPNLDWDQALQEQDAGPKDEAPAPTSPDAGAPKPESEDLIGQTEEQSTDDLSSGPFEAPDNARLGQDLPGFEEEPALLDQGFENEESAAAEDVIDDHAGVVTPEEPAWPEEAWQEQVPAEELAAQDTPEEFHSDDLLTLDDENPGEALPQDWPDEQGGDAPFVDENEAPVFEQEFNEEPEAFLQEEPQDFEPALDEQIEDPESYPQDPQDEHFAQELPEDLSYEPHAVDPDMQLEGGLTAAELAAMADEPQESVEESGSWEGVEEPQPPQDASYYAQGGFNEGNPAEPEPYYEEGQEDLPPSYEEESYAQAHDAAAQQEDISAPSGIDESPAQASQGEPGFAQEQDFVPEEQPQQEDFAPGPQPLDEEYSGGVSLDEGQAYPGLDQSEDSLQDEQQGWEQQPQDLQGLEDNSGSSDEAALAGLAEQEQGLIDPHAELDGGITPEELAAMAGEPEAPEEAPAYDEPEQAEPSAFEAEALSEEPAETAADSLIEDAAEPQEIGQEETVETADETAQPDLVIDETAQGQSGGYEEAATPAAFESGSSQEQELGMLAGELEKGPVTSGGYNADDLAAMMEDGSQERPLIDPYESAETADGYGADDLAGMMADPGQYDPKNVQDLASQLQQEMTEADWSDFNPEDLNAAAMGMGEDGVEEVSSADLEDEPAPRQHDLSAEIESTEPEQEVLKAEDSLTPDISEVLSEADRLKEQEQDLRDDPAVTWDVPAASEESAQADLASMLDDAGRPVASDLDRSRDLGRAATEESEPGLSAAGSNLPAGTDEVLSQVASAALSESGPIGQSSRAQEPASYSPLSEEEKQRFNDNLNLALLYFETGDVDDAMELINEIKHCADHDLALKAYEMAARYGL